MVRFDVLEKSGVIAVMSDVRDGNCALVDDSPECCGNRRTIVAACGLDPSRVVGAQQVHGTRVAWAGANDSGNGLLRANAFPATDGLATAERGLPLTVTIADCVPLFLVDPIAHAIALVHAGRVGTQGAIAREAVRAMAGRGVAPDRVVALIGPSAGPCCYEVGADMLPELDAAGVHVRGHCVDLWETNATQLATAGLFAANIHIDGRCTICHDGFHSHRAHANGCRNMALLAL